MLTDTEPPSPPSLGSTLRDDFLAAVGLQASDQPLLVDRRDQDLQVAIDSFTLRHHAAEAVARLYHGLAVADGPSVWANVVDGPRRAVDLVDEVRTHLHNSPGHETFWTLVLPPDLPQRASQHDQDTISRALNVHGAWLRHALRLLVRDDIDLNAAHNKIKHGLAVRPQDDQLWTFTSTPPASDGSLPLSALTGPGAVDIFDGPTADFLARPPKTGGQTQGLELTTLNLKPHLLLAETWMLATLHAAMFSLAAARHFAGRQVDLPAYPTLHVWPTADELLTDVVVGMRQPVTNRPDGGQPDRRTGLGMHQFFVELNIDHARASTGTVTEG